MLIRLFVLLKHLVNFPYYIKKVFTSSTDKLPEYRSLKEPRVAFCLYGVIGGIKGRSGENKDSSKEVLEIGFKNYNNHIFKINQNVDVFIHSWSTDLKKEIKSLYNPKLSIIQKQIIFKIPEYVTGNTKRQQGSYSRWYSTKKVIELKSEYEKKYKFKYDIVMLSRFDIAWQKDLIFRNFNPKFFYVGKTYMEKKLLKAINLDVPIGYPYIKDYYQISDLWSFSNSDNINRFSTLFNNLDEYTKPGKSLATKHGISSHTLVYQHLKEIRFLNKLKLIFKHSGYSTLPDEVDPLIRRKYFNAKI